MTILPKHDEASVDKKKIISVPTRFVRTNRSAAAEEPTHPGGACGPGHQSSSDRRSYNLAPRCAHCHGARGQLQSDRILLRCAGCLLEWFGNGTRVLYARAPREGLSGIGEHPPVKSLELLQILERACGLMEALRLTMTMTMTNDTLMRVQPTSVSGLALQALTPRKKVC